MTRFAVVQPVPLRLSVKLYVGFGTVPPGCCSFWVRLHDLYAAAWAGDAPNASASADAATRAMRGSSRVRRDGAITWNLSGVGRAGGTRRSTNAGCCHARGRARADSHTAS